MEAYAVKQFFSILSSALVDGSGSFSFTDEMKQKLSSFSKNDTADQHDISNIVDRLKQNALGNPDPYDRRVRSTPETLIPFACELLEKRWDKIKDKSRDYLNCSDKLNEPYTVFVKQLYEFSLNVVLGNSSLGKKGNSSLEVKLMKWMPPFPVGKGQEPNFHALLIPTLKEAIEPVTKTIITKFSLNEFVLSEDERSLIFLKNSQKSFDDRQGFLNADVEENVHGVLPLRFFTPREKQRIHNKPPALQPPVITKEFVDYILTTDYLGPAIKRDTKEMILNFVSRRNQVKHEPILSLDALKQKYCVEKNPLEEQDIEYLWQARAAEIRTEDRMTCNQSVQAKLRKGAAPEVKEQREQREREEEQRRDANVQASEKPFKDELDKSGPPQDEKTLNFLVKKGRQAKIAIIAGEMLVYTKVLKKEHFDEYKRLQNQVFYEPGSKPKTFALLLERVAGNINLPDNLGGGIACADATFVEIEELLKHVTLKKRPMNGIGAGSESPTKRSATPVLVPSSEVSAANGWAFFPSAPDPASIIDPDAYSPERGWV